MRRTMPLMLRDGGDLDVIEFAKVHFLFNFMIGELYNKLCVVNSNACVCES